MYNDRIKKGNVYQLKKILVALAGPLLNIIIGIIFNTNKNILYTNLSIALFNLLPIYPLDGGRIVKAMLHIIFGNWKSKKYINTISIITMVLITCISSYYLKNIFIVAIIIYLWGLVINERRKYQNELNMYNLIKSIENN